MESWLSWKYSLKEKKRREDPLADSFFFFNLTREATDFVKSLNAFYKFLL